MTDDEQPSRAELARRVEELEQTVQRMLPSRRQAIKMGGASLAGVAAFSAGNASADPKNTQQGTIGDGDEDLNAQDIISNHINTNTLEAEGAVINGEYHFASKYAGGDADTRLTNAISAADTGDVIYLENVGYSSDLTVSLDYRLIGTTAGGRNIGSHIDGATWTIDGKTDVQHLGVDNGATLQLNNERSLVMGLAASKTNHDINCNGSDVRIIGGRGLDVTLQSNSNDCIVTNNSDSTITDNGNNNIVNNNT